MLGKMVPIAKPATPSSICKYMKTSKHGFLIAFFRPCRSPIIKMASQNKNP